MLEDILERAWANLVGRLDGPMHFRFIVQPAVAACLAIRAAIRDARDERPPWLWAVFTRPDHRAELLRQGWKDVGKVFIVAVVLDLIYQLVFLQRLFPLELLITALVLALVPYVMLRGPVNRVIRWVRRRKNEPEVPPNK